MSYLPNDLSGDTVVSLTRVQQNDAALDTAISGNLTQANMSASTQFPNSMLASPNVEELWRLNYVFGPVVGGTKWGTTTNGAGFTTGIKDNWRLGGSDTYTILSADYVLDVQVVGVTGSTVIKIETGSWSGTTWTAATTLVNSTTLSNSLGVTSGALTVNTSTITAPTVLALDVTTAMTTPMQGNIVVTLRVKRALQ